MHVRVRSRSSAKTLGLGYKTVYNERLAVRAVLEDFAQRFSLPATHCTAWYLQNKLDEDAMLWEVKSPTLSMDAAIDRIQTGKGLGLQKQQVLTLDMEFTPSLALYIWQSFKQAPNAWGAVRDKDLANVWAIAAQVCSTQGCIATSMASSSQFLPNILNLDPVQTFSADVLLYQSPSESPHPLIMPQVEPLTQNLLLFAQLLTAVAAEGNSMLANMTAPSNSTSQGEHLRSAIAMMLQGLTDGSCCTPVLLTDTADVPQPLSKLVIMLRSAVLITKLATLTYNVRPDGHDGLDSVLAISVQTLWSSMAAVTQSLWDFSPAESAAVGVRALPANASSVCSLQPANKEEQTLCIALVEHLVLTLRQYLKEPHAKVLSMHQKLACLHLWEVLLTIMHPGQLGPEAKRLGALPLALPFLHHEREEAQAACQVLTRLCYYDLHSEHLEMLARLQGVRRLSNILCTVQTSKAHMKATGEKPSDTHTPAIDSKARLLEDVNATVGAAELMIKLLELCPLSPRPVDDDPNQTTEGNSTGQHCPAAASTQAQAVHQPALWPTPKPTDWHSIEQIAVKACMSLEWALPLTSLQRIPAKAVHKLTALLCHLIQCLVAGHLPDLGLDMQKLFNAGLHPILIVQVHGHAACSGLASAMLSRMAADSSVMSRDSTTARLIGAVFCKESAAAQAERHGPPAPSTLLTATMRVLYLVADDLESLRKEFPAAVHYVISAFSNSLLNRMWLCAALGAIPSKMKLDPNRDSKMVILMCHESSLLFTILEQVVQVPTCWDPELCFAAAAMLYHCQAMFSWQTLTVKDWREPMHVTLVQLLQQLHMIDDQRLQGLLLAECCTCLQNMSEKSGAALHKASVTAITEWIFAWEAADPDWKPQLPDPFARALGIGMKYLKHETILCDLILTLMCYLDSQQKWRELAPHALRSVLVHLCASMTKAAKLSAQRYQDTLMNQTNWQYNSLAAASRHQALQPPCLMIDSFKAVPSSASGAHNKQRPAEQESLVVLWRRAACAAVMLLSMRCKEACQHQKSYQGSKQGALPHTTACQCQDIPCSRTYCTMTFAPKLETLKLHQRKVCPVDSKLDMVQNLASSILIQKQIDPLVPALRDMQLEPAWRSIMAGHQPRDWPGPVPSLTGCHQDVVYLTTGGALGTDSAQVIHSFFSFMLAGDSATAAAEQLVAEEAHEAAKAAAKKAKKQKAKARKQQAWSGNISSSQPTASQPTSPKSSDPQTLASQMSTGSSLQTQQDLEPKASLLQSSPSEGRSEDLSPDQAPDSFQPDPQHIAEHETAATVHVALDEHVSSSDKPADGTPAASPAAVDASPGADARFLDQLFCCPITKVAMMDPMIAADGHTYERTAIQHWLEGSALSPVTGDKLPHTRLVPNVLVKSALAQHAQVS